MILNSNPLDPYAIQIRHPSDDIAAAFKGSVWPPIPKSLPFASLNRSMFKIYQHELFAHVPGIHYKMLAHFSQNLAFARFCNFLCRQIVSADPRYKNVNMLNTFTSVDQLRPQNAAIRNTIRDVFNRRMSNGVLRYNVHGQIV
jgi:hypothetical protein